MDERIALAPLTKIADKYIIDQEIGRGGSCIVYEGHYIDEVQLKHRIRIKELYPYISGIDRINDILVSDNKEEFAIRRERFINSYRKNVSFQNEVILNNTSVDAREIIEANDTVYIIMSIDEGVTLKEYVPQNIQECFEIVKSTAQALYKYHNNGYLHLDVKPDNILVLNDTKDMIGLFDFDSVTKIEMLKQGEVNLSFSDGFAAPELAKGNIRKICEATDIFSVGIVLFELLWGKKPDNRYKTHSAEFDFSEIRFSVECYSPRAFRELTLFFQKTISISIGLRYSNMNDVIDQLNKLIELFDEKKAYISSSVPKINDFFIGRDSEMEQIKDILDSKGNVYLVGEGGSGKSSLALNYAYLNENQYSEEIYIHYRNNWIETLVDDQNIKISTYYKDASESDDDYAFRKLSFLEKCVDNETLIIIDNLDSIRESEYKILVRFLSTKAHIIITTRLNNWDSNNVMEIGALSKKEDSDALFMHFSNKSVIDSFDRKLMERYQYNVLAIKLIAKQMVASRTTSEKILKRITEKGISNVGRERISLVKDGEYRKKGSYDIIKEIFDISGLNEEERAVMLSFSVYGKVGDYIDNIYELMKLDSYDVINNLIEKSWLSISDDYIMMHPLIAEVVKDDALIEHSFCMDFLHAFSTKHAIGYYKWNQVEYQEIIKLTERIEAILDYCAEIHLSDAEVGKIMTFLIPCLDNEKKNRNDKEIEYWKLAAENIKKYSGEMDSAYILCKIDLAIPLITEARYDEAMCLCEETIDLMNRYSEVDPSWKDCNVYGTVYNNIASIYFHNDDRENAAFYFNKAKDIQEETGDIYKFAQTSCHLADCYIADWLEDNTQTEKVDSAIDLLEFVAEIMEEIKAGKYIDAMSDFSPTDKIDEDIILNRAYKTLGIIYLEKRMLENCISFYKKAVDVLASYKGYIEEFIDCSYNIAHSLVLIKEDRYISAAKPFLDIVYNSIKSIGIERREIVFFRIVSYLGNVSLCEEDYGEAEHYFAEAIDVYKDCQIFDENDLGKTYYNLAISQMEQSKYDIALENLTFARAHILVKMQDDETLEEIEKKIKQLTYFSEIETTLEHRDFDIHFETDWNFLDEYEQSGGWYEFVRGDDFSSSRGISFDASYEDVIEKYGFTQCVDIKDITEDCIYMLLDGSDDQEVLKSAVSRSTYIHNKKNCIVFYFDKERKVVLIGYKTWIDLDELLD